MHLIMVVKKRLVNLSNAFRSTCGQLNSSFGGLCGDARRDIEYLFEEELPLDLCLHFANTCSTKSVQVTLLRPVVGNQLPDLQKCGKVCLQQIDSFLLHLQQNSASEIIQSQSLSEISQHSACFAYHNIGSSQVIY